MLDKWNYNIVRLLDLWSIRMKCEEGCVKCQVTGEKCEEGSVVKCNV